MNKLFTILALSLCFGCNSANKQVTPQNKRISEAAFMVLASHPNYCLLANGNISAPSGPINCLVESHIDEVCVAAARQHYLDTVRNNYKQGCNLARQYQHDNDVAITNCNGSQSCIDNANASLETNLGNLDGQVSANISAATASFWADASACCVPDGN